MKSPFNIKDFGFVIMFKLHIMVFTLQGGNFVLAFSPLVNGRNVITINTVKAQEAKVQIFEFFQC